MRAVKKQRGPPAEFEVHHAFRHALFQHVLIGQAGQRLPQIDLLRVRAVAPPEFEHVADDTLDALRIVENDAQQTFVDFAATFLVHQFAGMIDRGKRIADFVRDICLQPTERRQLELPGLFMQAPHILEKHQNIPLGTAGRHETGAQLHAAGRCANDDRFVAAVPAPGRESACKLGRIMHQHALRRVAQTEQALGAWIVLANPSAAVENEHAVLHFLDHALADQGLVAQIDAALARQFLVGDDPACQQARRDGDAEEAGAEQPRLKEVRHLEIERQCLIRLLEQYRKRRHRRVEHDLAPLPDQAGASQVDQQHGAQSAAQAAAGMHQEGQHQDIDDDVQGQLGIEMVSVIVQPDQ